MIIMIKYGCYKMMIKVMMMMLYIALEISIIVSFMWTVCNEPIGSAYSVKHCVLYDISQHHNIIKSMKYHNRYHLLTANCFPIIILYSDTHQTSKRLLEGTFQSRPQAPSCPSVP